MRVAVTGATGNLGSSVVPLLAADDGVSEVVAIARRPPPHLPARTTFAVADITRTALEPALAGCDALVHLAWAFQPTHDPLRTWDVNVRGGIAAFEAAARAGVRTLVHASSVGAYSPGVGRSVDETWPTHSLPTAAYGREKAYLERYLDAFELRHPDVRVVRLRPCFVFQRPASSEQARIFAGPLLPRTLLRPGRLPVVTAPALGEVLGARAVAVPDGVTVLATAAAWRLRLIPSDHELLRLLLSLPTLNSGRARRELRWQPVHTGRQALREALVGMAEGAGGSTAPLHPGR